jgi:hypothetical protein
VSEELAAEARELATTWRRMASVCGPGQDRLALESCALDLDRLAESWAMVANPTTARKEDGKTDSELESASRLLREVAAYFGESCDHELARRVREWCGMKG